MSASRRFHLWLPVDLEADLRSYARAQGGGLAPAIRELVRRGLDRDAQQSAALTAENSLVALAALIAAEHAVLMVASILPEGERRTHSLAERAAQAAEDRLALLRPHASESGEESQ
ncbi:MAG: hypothetical protein ACYDAL_17080 [Candidatus Dormibacteraceae bacterium]